LGLLEPSALLFLLLAAALWLFALLRRRERTHTVPALFLWETLPEPPSRRPQVDWLLLLQLAALSSLVFALARPYTAAAPPSPSRRHILVLDRSASMQAQEGERSRWQLALERLRHYVQGLAPSEEVELVAASHQLEVLVPATRDHERVLHALAGLEPYDTQGRLGAILTEVAASVPNTIPQRIVVFSDFADPDLPAPLLERAALFPVGATDRNLAVEEVQVVQRPWQGPAQAQAQVRLRNFSSEALHGLLTVEWAGEVVLQTGFTLPAHSERTVPIPAGKKAGLLAASVRADDALEADNRAWAWVGSAQRLAVCVAARPGAEWPWLRAFLRNTPMFEPATSDCLRRPSDANQLFVFYRTLPPADLSAPALVVQPPAPVSSEPAEATIVDWEPAHPLLRETLPDLTAKLNGAVSMQTPQGAAVVLWGRVGETAVPLVWTLNENDPMRRQVWVAFDLPSKLSLSPDEEGWLLFFFAALGFLSPHQQLPVVATAGQAFPLPAGQGTIRLVDPQQQEQHLDASQPYFVPVWRGPYRVERDGREHRLWVLAARGSESDIAPKLPAAARAEWEGSAQEVADRVVGRREWGQWILVLACSLLCIEAWVASRRARWNAL